MEEMLSQPIRLDERFSGMRDALGIVQLPRDEGIAPQTVRNWASGMGNLPGEGDNTPLIVNPYKHDNFVRRAFQQGEEKPNPNPLAGLNPAWMFAGLDDSEDDTQTTVPAPRFPPPPASKFGELLQQKMSGVDLSGIYPKIAEQSQPINQPTKWRVFIPELKTPPFP